MREGGREGRGGGEREGVMEGGGEGGRKGRREGGRERQRVRGIYMYTHTHKIHTEDTIHQSIDNTDLPYHHVDVHLV